MTEPVFLALGTNLGDREANLHTAKDSLPQEITILQESSIYITPPWGYTDQPEFLNQVVEVQASLEPLPLLHALKEIESEMGRVATFRNGPRLIDLDILFYGQRILDLEELQIPHPRLHERAFVLVPLNEIAPNFVHPALGKRVADLLTQVNTEGVRAL
jgi:2-amino-4-hydroxy-6-hydroxymethyldihydropteridine diphosphokinase